MRATVAGRAADHDLESFGVYVHVPFCVHRCDYCAFSTWTDRFHLEPAYVDAVVLDVQRAVAGGLPSATSVFFGGGTPSLLPAVDLAAILHSIPRGPHAEVTVECNPDTVGERLLGGYRDAGVNRLSFGVQSMVPGVLKALGRTHDPATVADAVGAARRAGFDNVNLDLIYGAFGESADDWRVTVEGALGLAPDHVSAYGLTVEPGTPLAADAHRHPDDDDQADKYLAATALLEDAGFAWYEISNFARPGRECRHNRLYWQQGNYRGFGSAAHSHQDGRRWWNVRMPERYIAAVESARPTEAGAEELGPAERRHEALQLSLRTRDGVPKTALALGDAPGEVPASLVEVVSDRLRLNVDGRLLANEVSSRLRT
ncbi:MAG: radical SAM family heme chaperone HemW [Actinobacteria bacterium]|nr:radical SAM family heme chaperone HemW [Actinomycetota bacterium]